MGPFSLLMAQFAPNFATAALCMGVCCTFACAYNGTEAERTRYFILQRRRRQRRQQQSRLQPLGSFERQKAAAAAQKGQPFPPSARRMRLCDGRRRRRKEVNDIRNSFQSLLQLPSPLFMGLLRGISRRKEVATATAAERGKNQIYSIRRATLLFLCIATV